MSRHPLVSHSTVVFVVLSAIIIVNILVIVLLQNRIAERSSAAIGARMPSQGSPAREDDAPPAGPAPNVIGSLGPSVRTLILTTEACPQCFDIDRYVTELQNAMTLQVEVVPEERLSLFTTDILPAIAFNESIEAYPTLLEGWEQVGYTITIAEGEYAGEWHVLPTINPPYYSLKDNRTHGVVGVTFLTKRSCLECYDVQVLTSALDSWNLVWNGTTVDADTVEGRAIMAAYNITRVPTLLMDEEASVYPFIQYMWNVSGTVEPDGTYVLRDLQRLQAAYYDTTSGKVMTP